MQPVFRKRSPCCPPEFSAGEQGRVRVWHFPALRVVRGAFGLLLLGCSRLRSCRFAVSSGEVYLAHYFRAGTNFVPGTYNAAFDDYLFFELTVVCTRRILLVVQRYAFGFQVYPLADIDPLVGTAVAAELLRENRIDIRFDQRIGRTFYVDPFLRKEIRNGGNAYFELLRNL